MDYKQLQTIRSRRDFFRSCAGGIGTVALHALLARDGRAAGLVERGLPAPHFAPRAKNVIFLFMAGAPSQFDLVSPKPALTKWHGSPVPESMLQSLADPLLKSTAQVFASPRTFTRYGESGMPFSDFLPNTGRIADDLCMVHSLHTDQSNHHPAQLLMNCGVPRFGHPCMGSWVSYGLGSECDDLPGFVVLTSDSGKGIDGGSSNWSNGFLPSSHRGVTFRADGDPVLYLSNPPGINADTQRARIDAIQDLNQGHLDETNDLEIASRIAAYEMAFRMQVSVPDLIDFSDESDSTRALYGLDHDVTRPFGTNCLMARRMVERGVRFVQLYHSTWDDHSELNKNLKTNCAMTDQPCAALITDLKQRGLLDETLVIWGGEFGRTPMNEVRRGNTPGKEGRDHHPFSFSMWMAGGGMKAGAIVGATDELGYHITETPIHVHDLQATILHCLGIEHTKLTYRHQGRDLRLTDIGGKVVQQLLA
jgi:hypothetical protein